MWEDSTGGWDYNRICRKEKGRSSFVGGKELLSAPFGITVDVIVGWKEMTAGDF